MSFEGRYAETREDVYYCCNGHITRSRHDARNETVAYCQQCGERNLSGCPSCHFRFEPTQFGSTPKRPGYCRNCGQPYQWTTSGLEAAKEVAARQHLSDMDRTELPRIIEGLVKETPQTELYVFRMKEILQKFTPEGVEAFKAISYNLVSSVIAKKLGWS